MHTTVHHGNGHPYEQHVPELPRDLAAERCFAGLAMMASDEIAAELDSFDLRLMFDDRHKAIVRAVQELRRSRQAVTGTSLREKLVAADGEEDWTTVIDDCSAAPVSHLYAAEYAGQIREAADARAAVSRWESGIGAWRQGRSCRELLAIEESRPASKRDGGSGIEYTRYSMAELEAADLRLDWAIRPLMVLRQPMLLAGQLKTMKTTLGLAGGISLSAGQPFLGTFHVPRPFRVAIMSGESGLGTIRETIRRVAHSMGLDPARDLGNLIVSDSVPRFDDPRHHASLEKFLRNDEIEILLIDPAFMACPSQDSGNLMAAGMMLRSVNEIVDAAGVTLILAHHMRKSLANPYEVPTLSDVAWSGFSEWARQWWLLARREKYEPGSGRHSLWCSVGGSSGHGSLLALNIDEGTHDGANERYWSVEVTDAEGARTAETERQQTAREAKRVGQLDADMKAIIQAAIKCPGQRGTKSDIRDRSGVNTNRFTPAFAELVQSGDLKPARVRRENGHEYDGWEANTDGE